MAFEDIGKLKERLAKDPASKLFVPLSEEYRKAGMFDEAIEVLQKGLEIQPSYMSARVALGKIYLEKDMAEEAKSEFEQVVKAIPDNLFAHKKLAEIYKDLGDPERAIKEYEIIVKLNPLDEDAKINIESLTGARESITEEIHPESEEPAPVRSPEVLVEEAPEISEDVPGTGMEETFEETYVEEETPVTVSEEDFEEFKKSISDEERTLRDETVDERKEEAADSPMFYAGEEKRDSSRPSDEPAEMRSILKKYEEEKIVSPRPSVPANSGDKGGEDTVYSGLKKAEEHIEKARFSQAVQLYNELLKKHPGNKKVLQKIEELKTYLKMIGKDKEELINMMELLLSGIKKRKDEFYGSS
jgi:tetratricopeptide (TPR) repeat protein